MSSNILSDRIVLELKGREPEVVYDITLDNCKVTTLEGFPAELNKLRVMSALNMGLNNLDGLPTLPELSMLDLSDNKMHDFVQLVEKCPNVEHLNLCGNLIKTIDTLKPLQNLSKLATLDLFKNDIVELPSYRADVFALIPHLKYLDGVDKEGRDMEVSDMDDEEEDDLSLGTEDSFSDESAEDVEDEDLETSIGLAYLQTSKALNEEDKSEDYEPNKAQNGSANVENEENEVSTNQDNGKRGIKRKHEADNAGPDTKM
uniref:Acidic leucine-rich nuclear phosphoprotein 32 family member A n=1 Tax=Acrobeloides nanus TaxID=290746 RepID=A0A914E867_9BILA